ncbi:MAG: tRNA uridine-5-carboxymethylaminomethyl(34) synthesis GTPase MnmE [Bacteroidetes bacterium]|nr:MAG: tRNA uridine-5-carboxymethylaminomethyl(34) synthesis GTPase MnmE [Bacteroidota bacterium]
MLGKLAGWDDTIVALATPPGVGAIAVIRLSGSKSFEIVNALFASKDLTQQASHTIHVGYLKENGIVLDEVVVSLYKAPASYTREDVIELSCHGSPYIQEKILEACIRHGARMAKPGEFTQRAFLHGKMDLTQAEAVADLIASRAEASRKSAMHSLRGGFSHDLHDLRERLLRFSALIELELDFSQEDVEFADRKQLEQLIGEASYRTNELLESFRLGNVIRNGVQAAIVGKPNSGKSTLLNALLNEERAIVSEIAGTTRDTIEELINIDGILFRLIDTAGIRQHTQDMIESMGMARSMEKIEQADVVIYLFDVAEESATDHRWPLADDEWPMGDEKPSGSDSPIIDSRSSSSEEGLLTDDFQILRQVQPQSPKFIFVGNKTDLIGEEAARKKFNQLPDPIFISARQGKGIESLKKALSNFVMQGKAQPEGTIVTHARHFQALQEVQASLMDIRKGLDNRLTGDLLALDIRRCLHYLGEITGEITNEEQLGYIFGKFCIGK